SLPTDSALAEMFEVMGELEAACVRLAAQRMSPAERVRLELVHRRSFEAVRNDDRGSYRTLNFEFHDTIYRGAHNGDAETASEVMRTHVNIVRAASWNYVHGLELAGPDPRTDADVDPAAARAAARPTQI